MRLDENVGRHHVSREVGTLPNVVRVFVRADIEPGPTEERAFDDPCREIGRKIVAEAVALVDDAPQRAAGWLNGQTRAVANACRINALVTAVGIERQHVGAVLLFVPRCAERSGGDGGLLEPRQAIGVVSRRTDRDEHRLVVGRKGDVTRPVVAVGRQFRHYDFGRARRHQIAAAIRKARHRAGARDIDPTRVGAGREKCDSKTPCRRSAKTSDCAGAEFIPSARKTRTRAEPLSATKTSPLGAVRITRGVLSPLAKRSTTKPGGALGSVAGGRSARRDDWNVDGVEYGEEGRPG